MGFERVVSKMRKRRRDPSAFINTAICKSDVKFFDDYIRKSPHWTDRWIHPKTHESYAMRFCSPETLTEDELFECRNLVDATSSKDYANSEMGWDADAKLAEMKLKDLRYILLLGPDAPTQPLTPPSSSRSIRSLRRSASPPTGNLLPMETRGSLRKREESAMAVGEEVSEFGMMRKSPSPGPGPGSEGRGGAEVPKKGYGLHGFISFMPTIEDGYAVVYCYEIHLVHALRGSGLGAQLISLLKDVARGITGVEKVMLTCFMTNEKAREFYSRVGFMIDDFSPQPRKMRNGKVLWPEHLILSWEVN